MNYTPLVIIKDIEDSRSQEEKKNEVLCYGDRRNGMIYRYDEKAKIAINVAVATGRPLLIVGPTGCGKSALAFNLARTMGRKYYEFVVSSRSQAKDLFYRYDAVRRLGDAQTGLTGMNQEPIWKIQKNYIEPGCLWWIYDPYSATKRGYFGGENLPFPAAKDPAWKYNNNQKKSPSEAVLLIDEIDKADIDFPNNLLVAIGSRQLSIDETGETIKFENKGKNDPLSQPLVIITSNQQRVLPETFVRRCIVLEIEEPTADYLEELAKDAYGDADEDLSLYKKVADKFIERKEKKSIHLNAAEFLDAVQALKNLKTAELNDIQDIVGAISWRSSESY